MLLVSFIILLYWVLPGPVPLELLWDSLCVFSFQSNFLFTGILSQLSEEGACEDVSGDGQPSTFNEWILPAKEFDGMWERLMCNFFTFSPISS